MADCEQRVWDGCSHGCRGWCSDEARVVLLLKHFLKMTSRTMFAWAKCSEATSCYTQGPGLAQNLELPGHCQARKAWHSNCGEGTTRLFKCIVMSFCADQNKDLILGFGFCQAGVTSEPSGTSSSHWLPTNGQGRIALRGIKLDLFRDYGSQAEPQR